MSSKTSFLMTDLVSRINYKIGYEWNNLLNREETAVTSYPASFLGELAINDAIRYGKCLNTTWQNEVSDRLVIREQLDYIDNSYIKTFSSYGCPLTDEIHRRMITQWSDKWRKNSYLCDFSILVREAVSDIIDESYRKVYLPKAFPAANKDEGNSK